MMIKCINCNKEFKAFPSKIKAGAGRYCSRGCFYIYRNKNKIFKRCIICDKKYRSFLSEDKKYCSRKCYFKRNGSKTTINCKLCKKLFIITPHHINKKYCSRQCFNMARSSGLVFKRNRININCKICNKEFETVASRIKNGNKFCSKKCYLVEHSKNKWTTGICKGCSKEFKSITHRHQICCSLSCNAKWRRNKHGDSKRTIVKCLQCGKERIFFKTRIRYGRGRYCSAKCWAIWMSINRIGDKCSSWKGGITPLYRIIRSLSKYLNWRKKILKRDKYKCIKCRSNKNIEVDHIYSFRKIIEEYKITNTIEANLCEALWNIKNGRVLCKKCHKDTENWGYKGV